jgi:hypothetical protein
MSLGQSRDSEKNIDRGTVCAPVETVTNCHQLKDYIIQNWLRNRNTIDFLGIWDKLYNPDFKPIEFDGFRNKAGLNSFVLTPKMILLTTHAPTSSNLLNDV